MNKKMLGICLSICLVFCTMPVTSHAEEDIHGPWTSALGGKWTCTKYTPKYIFLVGFDYHKIAEQYFIHYRLMAENLANKISKPIWVQILNLEAGPTFKWALSKLLVRYFGPKLVTKVIPFIGWGITAYEVMDIIESSLDYTGIQNAIQKATQGGYGIVYYHVLERIGFTWSVNKYCRVWATSKTGTIISPPRHEGTLEKFAVNNGLN